MTPTEKVLMIAGQIVLETPARSQHSYQSYVSRRLLAELEEALIATGIDMAAARERYKRALKEAKRNVP